MSMCCFEDQVTGERCRTLFNRPLTMVVPFIQGNLGILWNIHEYSVFLTTPGSSAKWVDNGGYSESKPRYSESVCPHDSWISWSIKVHQCRSETVGTLHPHGSTPWICSFEMFFCWKAVWLVEPPHPPKKRGKTIICQRRTGRIWVGQYFGTDMRLFLCSSQYLDDFWRELRNNVSSWEFPWKIAVKKFIQEPTLGV